MRRFSFVFLIFSFLVFLTSCEVKFDWPWLKDKPSSSQPATPTGETVSEERSVGAFDEVKLEGFGKLVFDSSVPTGIVRVQADQGLLTAIKTTVSGSKLILNEEGANSPGSFELEYRLAATENLDTIILAGMGTIETNSPLTTQDLTVSLEGVGKVALEVQSKKVTVRQTGPGELVIRGTADRVEVQADGLGRVDVSALITKEADVESNGVGEVSVYASEKLRVRATGLGAVHFYGHPATTDVQTEGLTKVSAKD